MHRDHGNGPGTKIRPERKGDEAAIRELTIRAFEPMPYSDGSEAGVIDRLRMDGDLTISLVAVKGREVVGHIAFSPVFIDGGHDDWYALGPISVRPDLQNTGIGSELINTGLSLLRSRDAAGCALIGNPAYYSRFGFENKGELSYGDVPRQYVQWLSFRQIRPNGNLKFAPAFDH